MTYNAECLKRRLAVLVIAMSLLSGCATDTFDVARLGTCPPVVEYSGEFQAQAAEELTLLPEGSAIAVMLSDYAVVREQARQQPSADRCSSRSVRLRTMLGAANVPHPGRLPDPACFRSDRI